MTRRVAAAKSLMEKSREMCMQIAAACLLNFTRLCARDRFRSRLGEDEMWPTAEHISRQCGSDARVRACVYTRIKPVSHDSKRAGEVARTQLRR